MKLVKMSLAAAVLLSASAFALDNVKVSGDAKLYYSTNNAGTADLFDKGADLNDPFANTGGAMADTALRLGVTGDLLKGVSFGATAYAVSTLGLENNLVGQIWTGAHLPAGAHTGADFGGGAQVNDAMWLGELWLATTMGKTTAKIGRMELDTPLAFSEKWNIAPNTFEAAVLINQDLPDTTLVGAWVGKSNAKAGTQVIGDGAAFNTFAAEGAYAAGLVNNSFKPLTAQAWYYNVLDAADAYWLQADINCKLVPGVKIGAQYAEISPKASANADTEAYAVKLGYSKDALNAYVAYSDVDDAPTAAFNMANVATGTTSQSKLYTEAWWNYGYVGVQGAESMTVAVEYDAGIAKLGAYYTDSENDSTVAKDDLTEVTLTATKSFGPLDATLAYISTDAENQNIKSGTTGSRYDTVQAYLTLNF